MFDRHQAKITVTQFRGHSLPVHQSMNVSWAFTLSHFVSQIHLRDFFRLLAIGMCHFLPVHPFGMACLAGSKVSIQQKVKDFFRIILSFDPSNFSWQVKYCHNLQSFLLRCGTLWELNSPEKVWSSSLLIITLPEVVIVICVDSRNLKN